MIQIIICTFFICFVQVSINQEQTRDSENAEKLYMKLFKRQRAEQLNAIKDFKRVSSYDKQYSMILLMTKNIFTVIEDSRIVIESSPYIPGVSEFPLDDKIKEALSNILENTALFSEVLLRFPDITTSILKTNNNWDVILQWGITFSYQMNYLLDKNTIKLLNLVRQELNYTERDPNYTNPYRLIEKQQRIFIDEKETSKEKKKKKMKKTPRLSNHVEL